jgi:lipopolysaccharide biosynthesis glycosyltransferase
MIPSQNLSRKYNAVDLADFRYSSTISAIAPNTNKRKAVVHFCNGDKLWQFVQSTLWVNYCNTQNLGK